MKDFAVAILGGAVVALIVFGLGYQFSGGKASTPMMTLARSTSDSLSIVVNNPGPDTLWIAMLARDETGALFTSRLRALAPGAKFSVDEKTAVLRGFRLYDRGIQ